MTAHPLNELLKKGAPEKLESDEDQEGAFQTFIDAVCSPPGLVLPIPERPYIVDTDRS